VAGIVQPTQAAILRGKRPLRNTGPVRTASEAVGGVTPSMVVAWAHGAREGGAPLVVLALLLAGVVALETVGRGVVALVRRLG
jgi:hypothetical protein